MADMTPLPFTGVVKIDTALTAAWQARLSINIKSRQVAPLFDGDPPWTQWSVTIRRPDRHPGTMLSRYDRSCYAHLIWHTRRGRCKFAGGWKYSYGHPKGWQVRTRRDLYLAIDRVSIGI